jgi:hypothetical protein
MLNPTCIAKRQGKEGLKKVSRLYASTPRVSKRGRSVAAAWQLRHTTKVVRLVFSISIKVTSQPSPVHSLGADSHLKTAKHFNPQPLPPHRRHATNSSNHEICMTTVCRSSSGPLEILSYLFLPTHLPNCSQQDNKDIEHLFLGSR